MNDSVSERMGAALQVVALLLPTVVSVAAAFAIVGRDERRLPPDLRARCWPPTTRAMALVVFGAFAVPVHFARTRRSGAGLLLGIGWGLALLALDVGVAAGVDSVVSPLAP